MWRHSPSQQHVTSSREAAIQLILLLETFRLKILRPWLSRETNDAKRKVSTSVRVSFLGRVADCPVGLRFDAWQFLCEILCSLQSVGFKDCNNLSSAAAPAVICLEFDRHRFSENSFASKSISENFETVDQSQLRFFLSDQKWGNFEKSNLVTKL